MKTSALKELLLKVDGSHCLYCVFQKEYPKTQGLQIHHCLAHRSKRFMEYLDTPFNCHLVCQDCHATGFVNGHKWREEFLEMRIKKFGKDAYKDWWNSLPDKLKLTNDWIQIRLEEVKN